MECQPSEEAQADFGYAGLMRDDAGNLRKTWSFVMVLSWSHHLYVEFVTDQTIATWLNCHRHALDYFGGVPGRIVIDNLKAGITRAVWDEPQLHANGLPRVRRALRFSGTPLSLNLLSLGMDPSVLEEALDTRNPQFAGLPFWGGYRKIVRS